MSAEPSYVDDVPMGFTEADAVHAQSWQEELLADDHTVKTRAWSSDLLAAFRTAQAYFARKFGDELRAVHGNEWAKILENAFKVYAALIDAAGKADEHKAKVRRFPLAAWEAQAHLSRLSVPPGLTPDEFERFTNKGARAWRRYGWTWVHKLQLITGAALFEREAVEFSRNHGAAPAFYTDHFTDLLIATIRKARLSRSRRVDKFERAFEHCFEDFRKKNLIPPYAPEHVPGPPDPSPPDPAPPDPEDPADPAKKDEPTVQVERIARRAIARAAQIAAELPTDEADACAIGLLEWIAEEWEKGTGRPFPTVPPVIKEADIEFSETADEAFNTGLSEPAADPSSCTPPQGAKCGFAEESVETPSFQADNMSYVTPLGEVFNYDPEPEPRGINLAEATAVADACASVVTGSVLVVWTDETLPPGKNCAGTDRFKSMAEFQENLPRLLDRNERSPVESMAVRIRFKGDSHLWQIDDCSPEVLARLAPYSFFQPMTSPGNGQTFLALSKTEPSVQCDEAKDRLFAHLNPQKDPKGANSGAHGSVRWPGSLNRKPTRRYADGESPRVQTLRLQPGRVVTIAELDAAGLLAPPPPKPSAEAARAIRGRFPGPHEWPDMNHFLAKHGGDRSRAESAWCVRALSVGHTRASVEAELACLGKKASVRRRDGYIRDTVAAAARYLGLNPPSVSASFAGGAP